MKMLACAHPTEYHKFGDWFRASDSEAEAFLALRSGPIACYALMQDLGPDAPTDKKAEAAPEAPAEAPAEALVETVVNDAPETAKKRSGKAAE